jgi:Fe-Mn family superoxide dismutase
MHKLPEFKFAFDALEPVIDARTMEIHYSKHHQTYIDKLNAALEGDEKCAAMSLEDLLTKQSELPAGLQTAVRNHAGGHHNHSLFWEILTPGGASQPSGELLAAIEKSCGSFEEFKKHFAEKAAGQFGSGWGWLVKTQTGEVEIITTANQDSPLMQGLTPILGVDVWEHAYYLSYQNRRPEYLEKIWGVINWSVVEQKFNS